MKLPLNFRPWQSVLGCSVALLCLTCCFPGSSKNKAFRDLYFNMSEIGKSYVLHVEADSRDSYDVDLRVYLRKPNKISHFFDKRDRRYYEDLDSHLNDTSTYISPSSPGYGIFIPATFRIRIERDVDHKIIHDSIITNPDTNASYMSRWVTLAKLALEKGGYTITVDYLKGSPSLAPLYGRIGFCHSYYGK